MSDLTDDVIEEGLRLAEKSNRGDSVERDRLVFYGHARTHYAAALLEVRKLRGENRRLYELIDRLKCKISAEQEEVCRLAELHEEAEAAYVKETQRRAGIAADLEHAERELAALVEAVEDVPGDAELKVIVGHRPPGLSGSEPFVRYRDLMRWRDRALAAAKGEP